MHVWPTFNQLNVCGKLCTVFWTYLLKMYKKPIQIDGLHSCLGEEGPYARSGTYLTHSQQDTRYNASHVYFVPKGTTRLGFNCFSVLFHPVTNTFNTYLKNLY